MAYKKAGSPTGTRKRDRKNAVNRNQDKHRWRNFFAGFIPFLAACVSAIVATHGDTRFWVAVVSLLLFLPYTWVLLERYICRSPQQQAKLRAGLTVSSIFVLSVAIWQRPRQSAPAPLPRPWLRLTDEERSRFIELLASQTEPRERVRLGCPASSEEICVLVTPFVDAFKRGHFIVENNRVERVTLGQPTTGVVLFKYGSADEYDPQDPDQGVWVRHTPTMEAIEGAFAEVGINLRTSADQALPADVVGVYFGIEPTEPIERQNLRELRRAAEEQVATPKP